MGRLWADYESEGSQPCHSQLFCIFFRGIKIILKKHIFSISFYENRVFSSKVQNCIRGLQYVLYFFICSSPWFEVGGAQLVNCDVTNLHAPIRTVQHFKPESDDWWDVCSMSKLINPHSLNPRWSRILECLILSFFFTFLLTEPTLSLTFLLEVCWACCICVCANTHNEGKRILYNMLYKTIIIHSFAFPAVKHNKLWFLFDVSFLWTEVCSR